MEIQQWIMLHVLVCYGDVICTFIPLKWQVKVEVKLMKNKTCRLHSEKKDRSRFQRNFEIRDLSVIFEILVNNFKIICVNFQTTENRWFIFISRSNKKIYSRVVYVYRAIVNYQRKWMLVMWHHVICKIPNSSLW